MAQSGNWIPNLINWLIGAIMIQIWQALAVMLFNWVMMWQTPLDGIQAVYEGFAPSDVGSGYSSSMSVGNGGTWDGA